MPNLLANPSLYLHQLLVCSPWVACLMDQVCGTYLAKNIFTPKYNQDEKVKRMEEIFVTLQSIFGPNRPTRPVIPSKQKGMKALF